MRNIQHDMSNDQKKYRTKAQQKSVYQSKDAEFLTWQKTPTGEVIALFNITAQKHPSYGSTVSAETLHNLKLKVPSTPPLPPSYTLFKFPKK